MIDVIAAPAAARGEGWFVVWTASRAEKKVESRIAAMGIEAWLPTVTERRRWRDRWRGLVTPLFPGYIFARGAAVNWHQLLRTTGVLTVVKEGGRPAWLTNGFVASLRRAIECPGVAVERIAERAKYSAGDEVIVQEGVLTGVRGVVCEHRVTGA